MLDKSYLNSVRTSYIIAALTESVDLLKTFAKFMVGFGTLILSFISINLSSENARQCWSIISWLTLVATIKSYFCIS